MDFDKYKVAAGQRPDLNEFDCKQDGGFSDDKLKDLREDVWKELPEYQDRLYAESKQSLLIVLQAMDAAGKDSTIDKLTSCLNSHGCNVRAFKKPSKREMAHDFLWRVHAQAPEQGGISIFNRSHYEDVLVVKVHGWASEEQTNKRYQHINNFESLLADRGTQILKFMLHISPEYQLGRFKSRLVDSEKHWKFNPGDLDERALWADYMNAFADAIEQCSPESAPWYVVPAENRRFRDWMIASVILNKLKVMNPEYPAPEFDITQFSPDSLR